MVDFPPSFPLTFAVWLFIIRLAAIQEFLFFLGKWEKTIIQDSGFNFLEFKELILRNNTATLYLLDM